MAKKKESGLQRRIRAALEKEVGGFWFKVHGGPFQVAGIPDLLGCVDGYYVSVEVKVPGSGKTSDIQDATIDKIKAAGGIALVATSPSEAVFLVWASLRAAGWVPTRRSGLYARSQDGGLVLRSRNRKDLGDGRSPRGVAKPIIRRAPRRFTPKPRDHVG